MSNSYKYSRAIVAYNLIIKLGLNSQNNPSDSKNNLFNRVSETFQTEQETETEDIIFTSLENFLSLRREILEFQFAPIVQQQNLSAPDLLINQFSPVHWHANLENWRAQMVDVLKNLMNVHYAICNNSKFQVPDNDELLTISKSLINLIGEIEAANFENGKLKSDLLRKLRLIVNFLQNSRVMPMEEAAYILDSALILAIRFKTEVKKGSKNIGLLNTIGVVVNTLIFVNGHITELRDAKDNIAFANEIAASIKNETKKGITGPNNVPLALPAPEATTVKPENEED